jgi:hypothetical protein
MIRVLALLEPGDVRLLVGVGFRVEQRLNHVGVAFCRGAHQRRLFLIRVHRVHVSVGLEQQLDGWYAPGERGGHQRRLAFGVRQRRIGTRAQQRLDDFVRARSARLKQRRNTVFVRQIRVGPRRDQRTRHRNVRVIRGP